MRHCADFLNNSVDEAGVRPIAYHGLAGIETARVGRTHFDLQFGNALRRLIEAVAVLTDKERPQTCAFSGVTEYTSGTQSIMLDLTKSGLFPLVRADGSRGAVLMIAQSLTATLQGHLRIAGLPDHLAIHSFRVGGSVSKSLAGTVVDEIMKIGGWKAERIAKYYIGSTTSTRFPVTKRTRNHDYAHANE